MTPFHIHGDSCILCNFSYHFLTIPIDPDGWCDTIEINIFDITPIGTKKWKRAQLQYEHILQPINEKIALVLKSKIHQTMHDTRKVRALNLHIRWTQSFIHLFFSIFLESIIAHNHIEWHAFRQMNCTKTDYSNRFEICDGAAAPRYNGTAHCWTRTFSGIIARSAQWIETISQRKS